MGKQIYLHSRLKVPGHETDAIQKKLFKRNELNVCICICMKATSTFVSHLLRSWVKVSKWYQKPDSILFCFHNILTKNVSSIYCAIFVSPLTWNVWKGKIHMWFLLCTSSRCSDDGIPEIPRYTTPSIIVHLRLPVIPIVWS